MAWPYTQLSTQWSDNELVNAVKMNARVDQKLNLLQAAVLNPVRFKGSFRSATAITASTAIKYPMIIDTASAWNVSTGQYTFPLAGTYRLSAQHKWGNVTPGASVLAIQVNGSGVLTSVNPPNAAFSGPSLSSDLTGISAGDVLTAQVNIGFTTLSESPADNNFLILTWTGV